MNFSALIPEDMRIVDSSNTGGDTQRAISGGAAAGIVLVVVVGVAVTIALIAVLLAVFCLKRRQQNASLSITPGEGKTVHNHKERSIHKQPEGTQLDVLLASFHSKYVQAVKHNWRPAIERSP